MLQPNSSDAEPTDGASGAAAPRRASAASLVTVDPSWRAGRKLEEARRQLGLNIPELAERLRVRPEYLEALEAMNAKLLPGKAYALAFLRSYAKALGLDENAIAEQFQEECALTREDPKKQIRDPHSRPHPERPWLAAAAILVAALGFFAWRVYEARKPDAPVVAHQSATPAVRHDAQQAPAQAETRMIEIRALAPGWLEARGPDGTVFLSREMAEGDVYRPDPSPGWTIHARDGGAFEVYVNGASAGLLGPPGAPVLGRPLDDIQPAMSASIDGQ